MDYYVFDTKYAYNFRLGNHLKTEYRKELDESHESPISLQNPQKSTKQLYFFKRLLC